MKQIYVVLLVALSAIFVGCAGQSSAFVGDKETSEVLAAKKAIASQVKDYQNQIVQYQEENERLNERLDNRLDNRLQEAKKAIAQQIKNYQEQMAEYKADNERLSNRLDNCEEIEDSTARVTAIKLYRGEFKANDSLITDCQNKISKLEGQPAITQDSVLQTPDIERLRQQISRNNSLISGYQERVSRLESQVEDILVRGVGKDKINSVVLNGYDAREVADAYATVKYVDGVKTGNYITARNAAAKEDTSGLMGVIDNRCPYDVIAEVRGPGTWRREFKVTSGKLSPLFPLPMPGNYTTVFTNCRNNIPSNPCTKPVGPNIIYHINDGVYDYVATALP